MTTAKRVFLSLDVGHKRIGLATGDSIGRIATPLATLTVDGGERSLLQQHIHHADVTDLVIGRPRNQAGHATAQTAAIAQYAATLQNMGLPIHWQDESVTSVLAEERLKARKKTYTKSDIDAEAAAIILQDFLETLPRG